MPIRFISGNIFLKNGLQKYNLFSNVQTFSYKFSKKDIHNPVETLKTSFSKDSVKNKEHNNPKTKIQNSSSASNRDRFLSLF
jgi:hypothetical protein